MLEQNKWVSQGAWSAKDIEVLNKHLFLTSKRVVYLINLSQDDFIKKKNKWLPKIKEWITSNVPGEIIPYSAEFEQSLVNQQEQGKVEEAKDAP